MVSDLLAPVIYTSYLVRAQKYVNEVKSVQESVARFSMQQGKPLATSGNLQVKLRWTATVQQLLMGRVSDRSPTAS